MSKSGSGPGLGHRFTENGYLNILESMGHSIHIFDPNGRILYWNRSAENLYGFSETEALGKDICELLITSREVPFAELIMELCIMGQVWSGLFPITHKMGHKFLMFATNTPFYDDNGTLIGIIVNGCDSRAFEGVPIFMSDAHEVEVCQDQSLQTALASKLTNLAMKVGNKVRSKLKTEESNVFRENENVDRRHFAHGFSNAVLSDCRNNVNSHGSVLEGRGNPSIHKILTSIGKKTMQWSGKGTGQKSSERDSARPEIQRSNYIRPVSNDASGSSSSFNVSSSSTESSSSGNGNGSSSALLKLDAETDILDYEIMWKDLQVGEQIGRGSCGTVYHGLWYGSDVAIKVFSKQEYSEEVVISFRQEVSLMKRLRHPNILLFMGAVTSPQRLCIVTEFLPRGSLYQLLQRSTTKLDWKRRLHMALDIARGMNYLHNCNPPIVHRDLKSSNLLVDKNWSVKVGDFGLSRVKHETYLTTKTGRGTPQWMAPEVLQNERSNEKSDLYSFGVVLWELATQKIPWEHLNPVQVIGAVGFMNQRLDIPEDIDPRWASMIESCWHSEPQSRPTFRELLEKLKEMEREYMMQCQKKVEVPKVPV